MQIALLSLSLAWLAIPGVEPATPPRLCPPVAIKAPPCMIPPMPCRVIPHHDPEPCPKPPPVCQTPEPAAAIYVLSGLAAAAIFLIVRLWWMNRRDY